MHHFFLGIDGGQSSTTALIADEDGVVIGWAVGGPCNHVTASAAAAKFSSVIGGVVAAACTNAGLDPAEVQFESAFCGMSGGPDDKIGLLKTIIRARKLEATDDGVIALAGALAGEPGVIVIGGTGTIAYGRDASGRIVRASGWGYIFGDEGGAFDIARQALRAILRFEEGWGAPTTLSAALLDATRAQSANQLLHLFYTPEWPRSRVATLARLVDSVANNGDGIARNILEGAAQTLASIAASVRIQLFASGVDTRVACIGGVFSSRVLRERFQMLVELTDGCHCVAPVFAPAAGALLEAFRTGGIAVRLSHVPPLK